MVRSCWKGPFILKLFLKKNSYSIKTLSRNSLIMPKYLNLNFEVHNGKKFTKISVTKNMIGHKFGEFVPTRIAFSFKKKKHGTKNKF